MVKSPPEGKNKPLVKNPPATPAPRGVPAERSAPCDLDDSASTAAASVFSFQTQQTRDLANIAAAGKWGESNERPCGPPPFPWTTWQDRIGADMEEQFKNEAKARIAALPKGPPVKACGYTDVRIAQAATAPSVKAATRAGGKSPPLSMLLRYGDAARQ